MGTHNPELCKGLESVFECFHLDWSIYGENSHELQNKILETSHNFKPDYVFLHIQSGNAIRIETIKELMKNSKVVNWTGDVRHPLPEHYLHIGSHINLTLYTNENDVETSKIRGVNTDFLQVGFDKTYFNPLGRKDSKYEPILFLGSNYPHSNFPLTDLRVQMVLRLKNEFGNDFGVYGGGWMSYGNGNITNYEEEGTAYRSCKIAINLSHYAYKRYSSDRLFRILGSGAFCLTHYFPEIEKDFKVGEELVVWENLDDLVLKIRKYLNNNNEREKIAIKGCALGRSKYTWFNFANELYNILKKHNL
jgi:spore maturation protein CgeB